MDGIKARRPLALSKHRKLAEPGIQKEHIGKETAT